MLQNNRPDEIVFLDTEVDPVTHRVFDIGAIRAQRPVRDPNGLQLHTNSMGELGRFLQSAFFLCGHNMIEFDLKYIMPTVESAGIRSYIDTLYLSPLLFPRKPYHRLLKDDKIQTQELNNPLNDAQKAMELFIDEVAAFYQLPPLMKKIYCTLLDKNPRFRGFFRYIDFHERTDDLSALVHQVYQAQICENADINTLAKERPIELAYCLSTISVGEKESIIPYWVQKNYPMVQSVYRLLRGRPCSKGCAYCHAAFNIHSQLKKKFGYDSFRCYDGEPLQEKAVAAAIQGKSLLAVFPTGGGKSITFQLPALIESETTQGLTIVISPLQSLMKDQVDNLSQKGITDAVTINGLLNTLERSEALERIENGIASILYISPESLRSKTIERLLLGRNIARFVIDEAHCFSSWGHDFRVDYLYIGDFIAMLREKKQTFIPVSCFTATAKQKVISDIKEYFKQKLQINLELFTSSAARHNLRYEVLYRENDNEKYITLRNLIEQKNCPTIVYASRTKNVEDLATKLTHDGFNVKAFHGQMSSDDKIANQDAFIRGDVQIITATSAFGMGVDKKDVKLVVHYDISDSLENYVQEAGRAGRDENIEAECYVLFNENDLDKHFMLLNQTKLSISEIQQVWKAIKDLTRGRNRVCCSALEIARQAGWDENIKDIETKVRTAISALETSHYVERGQNCPRVYADSIQVRTAQEAVERIDSSDKFDNKQKEYAKRIIGKLISTRSRALVNSGEAESRVDYIADYLGIEKERVIESVNLMREDGILSNEKEMSVYIDTGSLKSRTKNTTLRKFAELEEFLIEKLTENGQRIHYKETNEEALNKGIRFSTVNNLRVLLYFWIIKGYIRKPDGEINTSMQLMPLENVTDLKTKYEKRMMLARFIEDFFMERAREFAAQAKAKSSETAAATGNANANETVHHTITVNFSIQELQNAYNEMPKLVPEKDTTLYEIEEALLYLSKIGAFRLEGGFLVLYNAMEIKRLENDNKKRYKTEDYKQLEDFYNSKTQQIHIVGEYANMMVHDYEAALTFVNDYFQMEYKLFLTKYFKGKRRSEIDRNITPMKYRQLFENLSERQAEIIKDDSSKIIVVAAGPGSGKTMILSHKLASLMLLEDVKHEQLLMLTFSRAAAMEFKARLVELIGHAAYFVEIKTFHSYCFDLLGRIGNLEKAENVIHDAAQMILDGDVELDRITKTVLVLDESQDMNKDEYCLVRALMNRNDDMRVIAVGDDDQNIYEFRGSSSKYMAFLLQLPHAQKYELTENFRSSRMVVNFANEFVRQISERMKTDIIHPVKEETGTVQLIKTASSTVTAAVEYMAASMANAEPMESYSKSDKTTAILTSTNEQAYLAVELLSRKGFRAKLIQSNDGFSLYDLAEMRCFLSKLRQNDVPIISDNMWNSAKEYLAAAYSRSTSLTDCLSLLDQFYQGDSKKYMTDLENFLREAKFGDFYQSQENEICVSTIHKSKGHEFDHVFMTIDPFAKHASGNDLYKPYRNTASQESKEDRNTELRKVYVGITRAKSLLYLFYQTDYFSAIANRLDAAGIREHYDATVFPDIGEIILPMTHRDVFLSYSEYEKRSFVIDTLQSGDRLQIQEETGREEIKLYFAIPYHNSLFRVACASKEFCKKVHRHKEKGYMLSSAQILHIVKWRNRETGQESNIILPIVRMKKK